MTAPLPTVSIIITVYNKGKTVERAIKSAIGQSYRNCEVIVIDDCSTDKSLETIQKYHDQVKVIINDKNLGHIASRKIGVEKSFGDYITFLDADDRFDSETIENCIKSGINQPDIIQMQIKQRVTSFNIPISYKCNYNKDMAFEACLYDEMLFPIQCWGKLYHRNIIENSTPIVYSGFWGEDRLFNLPIMANSPQIIYAPNATYNYYWGGNSKVFNENNIEEYKQVYTIKINFLKSDSHKSIKNKIQQELIQLLEYDIRQRINSNKFTENEIKCWIKTELAKDFWKDVSIGANPEELYYRNKNSIKRIVKKYIGKIL